MGDGHPARTHSSFAFLAFFLGAQKSRTLAAILLLGLAGVLEGIGVMTLVPLLQLADRTQATVSGPASVIASALARLGLATTLPVLLATLFVTITLKAGMLRLAMTQVRQTQIAVIRDLRERLLHSMLRARWSHVITERSGAWANAMATESTHSGGAYREGCEIIAAVFPITIYLSLAVLISWQVTFFAIACGLAVLLILRGFVGLSRRAGTDQVRIAKALSSTTVDVLQGMKPVKAMAREHLIEPVFTRNLDDLDAASRRAMFAAENLKALQEPALALLLALSIYVLFEVGEFPLPTVMVLAFIFYRVLQHLNTLQGRYQMLVVGEASFWSLLGRIETAERAHELLRVGAPPGRLRHGILLRGISFSYAAAPVLSQVDLEIPAGTFVAIEGESGSGKTTLADLISGLHEPSSGQVLVDGVDLRELDLHAWRSELGYVPQEMLLLNDTIRQNVTLGDAVLSDDDVEHALKLSGAWDFVARSPDGIDTMVGERGSNLSGGQRQRIAIARALVTKPTLLILDEVTASLDPSTEASILATLVGLRGEVTILAISHQPAMRRVADVAYRLSAGRLVSTEGAAVDR